MAAPVTVPELTEAKGHAFTLPLPAVLYVGRSVIEPTRSLPRGAVRSRRSWFIELWFRGRYVGLAK